MVKPPATPPATLARYATLIRASLAAAPPAFDPQTEADDTIQVERGVCFPATLVGAPAPSADCIDRLLQPAAPTLRIVDQRGHRRPAYRGVLAYAALQVLHVTADAPPDWKPGLRGWAESIAIDLAQLDWPTHPAAPLPAAGGAATGAAAWNALALHVAAIVYDEPRWRALAATTFDQFARRQLPAGPFLAAGRADNPETHWYHELVLLHAIASYAVQSEGVPPLAAAVARSALRQEGDFLVAEVGGLRYPVREGIPVMLIEEAQLPDGVESIEAFKTKFAAQIPPRP
jgi:uncharacterized protein YbaR (Trm112 family)